MTAPAVDENVTSRFKVLERPNLSPGKCSVCGAVDRPVVTFGLNIWRYGEVVLCVTCVCEAGDRVGMIRPERLEKDTLQSGQSVEEYLSLTDQRVIPNELHDAITNLVGVCSSLATAGTLDVPSNLDDETSEVPSGQYELPLDEPVGKSEAFDL